MGVALGPGPRAGQYAGGVEPIVGSYEEDTPRIWAEDRWVIGPGLRVLPRTPLPRTSVNKAKERTEAATPRPLA
jgi:hypothetical protein